MLLKRKALIEKRIKAGIEVNTVIGDAAYSEKDIGKNQVDIYYFDVEKCKHYSFKNGCYKEGATSITYSVII